MRAAKWAGAVVLLGIAAVLWLRIGRAKPEDRVYRIGWEARPPFQEAGRDGRPTGLAIELVREAARRRGIRLEWVQDQRSSEAALRAKAVDLWPLVVMLPERLRFIHITEPYLNVGVLALVRADSLYAQTRDLDRAALGYLESRVWSGLLAGQFPSARLVPRPTLPAVMESLCAGRADAAVLEEDLVIMSLLSGDPCPALPLPPRLRLVPIPEIKPRMGIGSTIEAKAAADAIRDEISHVAVDDRLARLMSRGSYASFRQMTEVAALSDAERRGRWLLAILLVFAALLVLTLWQAARIRREGRRAREAERIARETERKLRSMAANLKEMVLAYDMNRRLIYANPATAGVTGYSIAEAEAQPFGGWVHPDDRSRMLALWDGVFNQGEFHDQEYRLVAKDGRVKWVAATWGAILDEAGRQVGVQGSERDITERYELRESLQQAERLETVGRLAGGLAHDFNNLLMVISGYSDLILRQLWDGHPLRSQMEEIRGAGGRAASLVQQLLAFSRKQIRQPKPLELNTALFESMSKLRRVAGEPVEVVAKLDAAPVWVMADTHQIDQVLTKLAENARDAMPGGGKLVIETASIDSDPGPAAHPDETVKGPCVLLSVTDTGCGMDDSTLQHLFEPFFTTKGFGNADGLGLSTVYGIVRQNLGRIEVQSELGKGTTFRIYFPRMADGQ